MSSHLSPIKKSRKVRNKMFVFLNSFEWQLVLSLGLPCLKYGEHVEKTIRMRFEEIDILENVLSIYLS